MRFPWPKTKTTQNQQMYTNQMHKRKLHTSSWNILTWSLVQFCARLTPQPSRYSVALVPNSPGTLLFQSLIQWHYWLIVLAWERRTRECIGAVSQMQTSAKKRHHCSERLIGLSGLVSKCFDCLFVGLMDWHHSICRTLVERGIEYAQLATDTSQQDVKDVALPTSDW